MRLIFSRRILKWSATLTGLSLALAAAFVWHAAGRLLEPAQRRIGGPPADFAAEAVAFPSESGASISAWRRAGEPGRGVVVLVHGIKNNRLSLLHRARLFDEAGFSTLMIDLRCHGESGPASDEFITLGHLERLDVRAAVRHARVWRPGEPVAVVGFSLGGAATALAGPLGVEAVVLEAVYPDIEGAVANRCRRFGPLGGMAGWALLVQLEPRTGGRREDLRPVDAVATLDCPVMIVGGACDQHTTPEDTRRLFSAAAEPKELVWFDDLGHSNFARWAPDRYRATVVEFVERYTSR